VSIAAELLTRVGVLGGTVKALGDQLRLQAPEPLPHDLVEALRKRKADILALLREPPGAAHILSLTLSEFERQDSSLAIRIPWMEGELWLAQDEEAAAELAAVGISRGRVFTVAELRDLMSAPGLTADQVRAVAQVKAEFSGRLTKVRPMAGREA
jgi:hypothetical protein